MTNGNPVEVPLQVAVRVRPLLGDEIVRNVDPCLYCVPGLPQIVIGNNRQFQFDHVFDQNSTQNEIYESCVSPLIQSFFNGYNATVFAYGQTGSGKTYTMGTGCCVYLDDVETGIIPRALTQIFLRKENIQDEVMCKLRVTFIEIYREETTDLLDNSSTQLQIREDEAGNTVVVGAREEPVENIDDVLTLLDAGTAMRHVGSTSMNEQSSRSHCIFTLMLDQCRFTSDENDIGKSMSSRFHFVDLAGSERAHRTGNQGTRFKESISINTGLLALGNVICALADTKRKNVHVPYRESKLTRLLKDSLGGNSRTVMVTCLSPALVDLDEDINSLKYASRAQKIRNKPIINWDREATKINEMEKEIEALRSQLKRRSSCQSEYVEDYNDVCVKINDLQMLNERHDQKEEMYLKMLHEINAIVSTLQSTRPDISIQMSEKIEEWRCDWKNLAITSRPLTAPTRMSRVNRDITEMLRNELIMYKERDTQNKLLLHHNTDEMDELRQEVIAFGEENAKLRLDLDVAINNAADLHKKMYEQQAAIQQMRKRKETKGVVPRVQSVPELGASKRPSYQPRDRVYERFRVKSDLLMSEMDDMDEVVHDEDISSDEERPEIPIQRQKVENDKCSKKCIEEERWAITAKRNQSAPISRLPRPIKQRPAVSAKQRPIKCKIPVAEERIELLRLESSRDSYVNGVKAAESSVRNHKQQMKELEKNIKQKEELIQNLVHSEHEAQATNKLYQEKLTKLAKDYEKSKKELEEAQEKIMQFQGAGNEVIDSAQRTKLENEYKKKLKVMQKKFDAVRENKTAGSYLTSYQQKNERRVKDLEGQVARMRNQQKDLGCQLKQESEKKTKCEQELLKNELRIKELELKTDQQQKLLRRKNEEVIVAQRKLRLNSGIENTKANEELEKKRLWIEGELENIVKQQKKFDLLQKELEDRDLSLQKKEVLTREKGLLEVKKTQSSVNLSKNIVELSIKMDTVDEQISKHNGEEKDMAQLQRAKENLSSQKRQLDLLVQTGGLEVHEERRLIELAEGLEAVEEALKFKNDLIAEKQLTIAEKDVDKYRNVSVLLNDLGDLSKDGYKHLLGKFILRVIELRTENLKSDEMRCELEFLASQQEKKLQDSEHRLNVVESKHGRENVELQTKHEQEVQFLMTQLRAGVDSRENSASSLDKKVKQLEKELYFYKTKFRQYKEILKDHPTSSNLSTVTSDVEEDGNVTTKEFRPSEGGVYFPPLSNPGRLMDGERKVQSTEDQQTGDIRRYQEAFDYKPHQQQQQMTSHTPKKRDSLKKIPSNDFTIVDSIEVMSRNPWHIVQ